MKTIENIVKGEITEFSKIISENDIISYAVLTSDLNPIHLNEDYAKKTRFKGRIAHGMLIAGLISAAISKHFDGAIYLEQNLRFLKAVKIGDKITAKIEVSEINYETKRIKLSTSCYNQANDTVLSGDAKIMLEEIK